MKHPSHAGKIIGQFKNKKVLVVGDIMLDEFVWGKVSRISPEAPVPVVDVQYEELYPGGAANVARNLRALDAGVWLMGRAGADHHGNMLLKILQSNGVNVPFVIRSADIPTTVKTRIIAKPQQVVRVDREHRAPLSDAHFLQFKKSLPDAIGQVDGVIVQDYGKGFVTQRLVDEISAVCACMGKMWTVDPKPNNPLEWKAPTAIKPNRGEAFAAAGMPLSDDPSSLQKVGQILMDKWGTDILLITLGEHGMQLFQRGKKTHHTSAKAKEVFDVSGAGDTAIAAFTLSLLAGATPIEATEIANHSAGVVVGKLGTATLTSKELLESWNKK